MANVLSGFASRTGEEALGFGIGTALGRALEPEATDLAQHAWETNPTLALAPDIAAMLVRLDMLDLASGTAEAARSGVSSDRFLHMISSLHAPPGAGELLELARRGVISDEDVIQGLLRGGLDERYLNQYMALKRAHLSPQEAAQARQQGHITQGQQYTIATLYGLDGDAAERQFEMAGLPPGGEQMIELWRRGEVDEGRVRESLIEGNIKLKYADDYLKLRYQPLSASVAAEALIRQRMTVDEAVAIADKNGLRRDDFLRWSDMLGRPIATGQGLTLARRGEFTFAQFKDIVARSDVRTEFADDLWKLRRVLPPLFQLVRLVTAGAISDETGTNIALDLGYDAEVAHGIVQAAKHTKTTHTRNLAAGQIDSLYESGLETHDWAVKALTDLGYDPDEARWHLELLDARRILAAIQSRLNLIHHEYVTHKIDEPTASQALLDFGVRTEVMDDLMANWNHEREVNVTRLTNAQIGRALKLGILDHDTAVARWVGNGYSADDAEVLAQLAGHARSGTNPTGT